MPVCLCYDVFWNRPTHYDVIASRDCRTAAHKHCTTARRSREKAWDTDAELLYVHPHVTDLLLPVPSTGCGRSARFMLHMLISASLRRRDDRHYWWSQRVICLCRANYGAATLACPLQSANAFSLWVLTAKPAGLDAAAARAPVLEKCNRSPVLKTGTG